MKNRHLHTLLDTSFTTISIVYRSDGQRAEKVSAGIQVRFNDPTLAGPRPRTYTFKAPKSLHLEAGDFVVVENDLEGLVVVKVDDVHPSPQIDVDADFDYRWIVQKIDRTVYDAQLAKEKEFTNVMLQVERTRQREGLIRDMREHLPEGSEARILFDRATGMISQHPAAYDPETPMPRPRPPMPGKI